jgi:hypothetical protein
MNMLEITRLKQQIEKSENLLKNPGFISKASKEKINLEKKKIKDFKASLKTQIVIINSDLLKNRLEEPFITYFIEEIRFSKYNGELFNDEYFEIVNMNNIQDEEKEELLAISNKENGLLELFKLNLERL